MQFHSQNKCLSRQSIALQPIVVSIIAVLNASPGAQSRSCCANRTLVVRDSIIARECVKIDFVWFINTSAALSIWPIGLGRTNFIDAIAVALVIVDRHSEIFYFNQEVEIQRTYRAPRDSKQTDWEFVFIRSHIVFGCRKMIYRRIVGLQGVFTAIYRCIRNRKWRLILSVGNTTTP